VLDASDLGTADGSSDETRLHVASLANAVTEPPLVVWLREARLIPTKRWRFRRRTRHDCQMLDINWKSDGRGGVVYEDEDFVGIISLVADWHEPQEREAQMAWVVQFMVPGVDPLQRALIDLNADPATDQTRRAELGKRAKAVVEQGVPTTPAPFGHAPTGLGTNAEIRELIQLTNYALESAEHRLSLAAQDELPDAVMPMNVAVTEMTGWLRGLDELSEIIWKEKLTDQQREIASQQADQFLSSPAAADGLVSSERAIRQANGKPYRDWTIALLANPFGWIQREELRGFRWLGGKMLHHGPLSAVELKQWRAGEPPRWKWRVADDIFPPPRHEQQQSQRQAYDDTIAGKDVLGALRFNELAYGVEQLFLPVLP